MDTSESTATNAPANPSKEEPTAATAVKKEGEDKMEVAEGKGEEKGGGNKKVTLPPASAAAAGNTASGDKKKSDEPDFQMIANPARVLPQQVRRPNIEDVDDDVCRYCFTTNSWFCIMWYPFSCCGAAVFHIGSAVTNYYKGLLCKIVTALSSSLTQINTSPVLPSDSRTSHTQAFFSSRRPF